MERATFRSGEVAVRAGVNVQTLRYYERRGLLKEPDRRPSGYREYPLDAVKVVRFIKRAQELGFTLKEVEDLLRRRSDDRVCTEVRAAARHKIEDIEEKVRRLRTIKRALEELVAACETNGAVRDCPVLDALDAKEGE